MTHGNFDRSLELVLKHEGGYVDHPNDPGGATNLGITIGTLGAYLARPVTKDDVKALTPSRVAPIYRMRYWDKVLANDLPKGIDYCLFDYAVNSGPTRAIVALQRCLNLADDGVLGPITLGALREAYPPAIIRDLCDERLKFLRRLSTWPTFGKGWTARVEGVERDALAMAAESGVPDTSLPPLAPLSKPEKVAPPAARWPAWFWRIFG